MTVRSKKTGQNIDKNGICKCNISSSSLPLAASLLLSPESQSPHSPLIRILCQQSKTHMKRENVMATRKSLFNLDLSGLPSDSQHALCAAADWRHFNKFLLIIQDLNWKNINGGATCGFGIDSVTSLLLHFSNRHVHLHLCRKLQ